mmetsp:Transcript_1317/g.3206  ORF Transcript_1317/g.3206 Transcript_1317/m.3206 type:complete len:210 (+) Transcript_1317:1472-2101(+)
MHRSNDATCAVRLLDLGATTFRELLDALHFAFDRSNPGVRGRWIEVIDDFDNIVLTIVDGFGDNRCGRGCRRRRGSSSSGRCRLSSYGCPCAAAVSGDNTTAVSSTAGSRSRNRTSTAATGTSIWSGLCCCSRNATDLDEFLIFHFVTRHVVFITIIILDMKKVLVHTHHLALVPTLVNWVGGVSKVLDQFRPDREPLCVWHRGMKFPV